MSERRLLWRKVEGNPLWLRGRMSRFHRPQSFAMAMAPERNAHLSDREFAAALDWIKETNFPAQYLTDGLIAFQSEKDITLFLLRWA